MYLKINVERFCDKICEEKLFLFNQRPTFVVYFKQKLDVNLKYVTNADNLYRH